MSVFRQNKKQISIFVTAGYPTIDSLNDQLNLLASNGIDFVEVGIPFSDPLADGPTIQATSQVAINNGMNLPLLFNQLEKRTSKIPIVLMGYFNPVLSYGIYSFLEACQSLDISSVILPDLSIELYERFYRDKFEAHGVYPSFLITPDSTLERIKLTAEVCTNSFVYLVSSNATTGGRNKFDQLERYAEIKEACRETPMFIGFGIQSRLDVQKVQSVSDGAIIGSAYLKALGSENEKYFLNELI